MTIFQKWLIIFVLIGVEVNNLLNNLLSTIQTISSYLDTSIKRFAVIFQVKILIFQLLTCKYVLVSLLLYDS